MDHMLRSMSSRLLTEWLAYYSLEPFGDEWPRTALLASLIAEVNRDPDKRSEPFTPEDFMPKFEEEPEDPDASWMRNKQLFEMLSKERT